MITAVRAFELAHHAIAGLDCHDAPCDVRIERTDDRYTVSFAPPAAQGAPPPPPGAAAGAAAEPTRVLVDARTERVGEIRGGRPPAKPGLAGLVSAARALAVGVEAARVRGTVYDAFGTTTVVLRGDLDLYGVTLPLPEAPPLTERADYALRVLVHARTGAVTQVFGAS